MNQSLDLSAIAKKIIDDNIYMVLATADENGVPWASPVYFGSQEYTDFYWVSSPSARHSLNISIRPQVSIVIFDSKAPIGTGQGVYMEAVAGELSGADLKIGVGIYSQASLADGASEWSMDEVRGTAPFRLYRAVATRHWLLDRNGHPNQRIQVAL